MCFLDGLIKKCIKFVDSEGGLRIKIYLVIYVLSSVRRLTGITWR